MILANFNLSFFTSIPGMLITGGVLLLLIALIIFIVTGNKDKKKKKDEVKNEVSAAVATTPSVDVAVSTEEAVNNLNQVSPTVETPTVTTPPVNTTLINGNTTVNNTASTNEEVTPDGRSERGNFPVYRKPLKQWVLRITCYADRLYNDLNLIDWPRGVVEMQREWIGPSNGALVSFLAEDGTNLNVFTTRPDTLPGVTFVAVAPEHPLAIKYAADAAKKMVSLARNRAYDDKSVHNGVFTGQYVLHPITKAKIPVWVGDYVLSGYGEGAVMGVPAHDQRDFEFALRFDIPIIPVIEPPLEWLKENAPSNSTEDLQNLYLHNPQNFKTSYEGDGKILCHYPFS